MHRGTKLRAPRPGEIERAAPQGKQPPRGRTASERSSGGARAGPLRRLHQGKPPTHLPSTAEGN
eukprot:5831500-Lingulodinium_polyedra.AAC.1